MEIRETNRVTGSDGTVWVTIVGIDKNGDERGILVFTEPNYGLEYEIFIQDIMVSKPRHQRVGSLLIDFLKELAQTRYNSAQIVVYITPLEYTDECQELDGLIKFYESNGFNVGKISNIEAVGIYQF